MNKIEVRMLGFFDLSADGKSVLGYLGNSSKANTLLQYLILNRRNVIPSYKLIDLFWEEEEIANPENALKTMISRIRSNLSKADPALSECLLSKNGGYIWKCVSYCEIDVFKFESLCEQVNAAKSFDDKTRKLYMEIVKIYNGDLCPPVTNAWLVSRSINLHDLYLQTVLNFLRCLEEEKDHRTIVQICQIALNVDRFDENINLKLLVALKDRNQKHSALAHYRHLTDLHYQTLGVSPPDSITNFYKELIKDDLAAETDIVAIHQELSATSPTDGAFVCDYSIFKDIYQLQIRNHNRNGQTMFLALISINNIVETPFEPLVLDRIARDLLIIIQSRLRKGDTISRYSPTQFAVLLPIMADVNGYEILDRIVLQSFYGQNSNTSVRIGIQIIDTGSVVADNGNHKDNQ